MYLLPSPKEIEYKDGKFKLERNLVIRVPENESDNVRYYAKLLQDEISKKTGIFADITKANGDTGIILKELRQDASCESYSILVKRTGIIITGVSEAGLLYGVNSLRQIIREYGKSIPCIAINDYPSIKVRGYSYDTTRGRVPKLSELKRVADVCAFYKINHLELNVEHSYAFKNEEEIWRGFDPLTESEIKEFDAYCKRLHIDLVPMLASFGHLYALLQSNKYSHLCELDVDTREPYSLINRMNHHTIDVTNPESFEVVKGRIEEFSALFSSKYFNICADETFDLGNGKAAAKCAAEGTENVYIGFLKKLCEEVISLGKTPLYWGDIIVKKPEIINFLPKDSICLNWEYDPIVKEDNLKAFTSAGAKNIYVCPGVQSWGHFINKHHDAYENISKMCVNAHKYNVKGILSTDWGDLGHLSHPEFSTIGLIYGAAFSWDKELISEKEINERISYIQYGDKKKKFVELVKNLSMEETFGWWNFVKYKETNEQIVHEGTDYRTKTPALRFDDVVSLKDTEALYKKLGNIKRYVKKLRKYENASDIKEVVNAYITMAEGMELVSLIAILMHEALYKEKIKGSISVKELETALKKWYMDYSVLWMSVSKPSELFRIGEIVDWYLKKLSI